MPFTLICGSKSFSTKYYRLTQAVSQPGCQFTSFVNSSLNIAKPCYDMGQSTAALSMHRRGMLWSVIRYLTLAVDMPTPWRVFNGIPCVTLPAFAGSSASRPRGAWRCRGAWHWGHGRYGKVSPFSNLGQLICHQIQCFSFTSFSSISGALWCFR